MVISKSYVDIVRVPVSTVRMEVRCVVLCWMVFACSCHAVKVWVRSISWARFPRGHLRPCTHDVDSVKQDPPFPGTMAFHVPTAKMPSLCIITSGIWLPVIKS